MPHCLPEQLARAALHEALPADDAAHLASCVECRSEAAALQRTVDAVAIPSSPLRRRPSRRRRGCGPRPRPPSG